MMHKQQGWWWWGGEQFWCLRVSLQSVLTDVTEQQLHAIRRMHRLVRAVAPLILYIGCVDCVAQR